MICFCTYLIHVGCVGISINIYISIYKCYLLYRLLLCLCCLMTSKQKLAITIVFICLCCSALYHMIQHHNHNTTNKNKMYRKNSLLVSNRLSMTNVSFEAQIKTAFVNTKIKQEKKNRSRSQYMATGRKSPDSLVFVICMSRRGDFERRDGIRHSWMQDRNNAAFFVGSSSCEIPVDARTTEWSCSQKRTASANELNTHQKKIHEENIRLQDESAVHQDIVVLQMKDFYRALPKKLKLAYEWGVKNTRAQWFLKIDDDSGVRLSALESFLSQIDSSKMYVIGSLRRKLSVPKSGKWAETNYNSQTYPIFANGAEGHVVSRQIAEHVYRYDGFEYQGEDVSLGIWISEMKLDVNWKDMQGKFVNNGDCHNKNYMVIGHDIPPSKMRDCFHITTIQRKRVYNHAIGRVGNQLFQIASVMGIAAKNDATVCLTGNEISQFFDGLPSPCHHDKNRHGLRSISENAQYATYHDFKFSTDVEITGYLQSYRYFSHDVRTTIKFKGYITDLASKAVRQFRPRVLVGIHMRKYEQDYLRIPGSQYFLNAKHYFTSKYHAVQFIVTCDDKKWCKDQSFLMQDDVHIVSEQNEPVVDMAILAACDHLILSAGTFGWWAAFLGPDAKGGTVVYHDSEFVLHHRVNKNNVVLSDFYPKNWIAMSSNEVIKIDKTQFQIHVLTMQRVASLKRLLNSLQATDYNGDVVSLIIHIDSHKDNNACIQLAQDFKFSHGSVEVKIAKKNKGLRNSWFEAWRPQDILNEYAIILEDDIEVSSYWYHFVKMGWKAYANRDDLAGISLQRQAFVHKRGEKQMEIVNNHTPFLYASVGSIGFSPHPKKWLAFLHWIDVIDVSTVDIHTSDLLTSQWFYGSDKRQMWTQYFIWFCRKHQLFTLFLNLPDKKTLASHMREPGEHTASGMRRDFDVATKAIKFEFPSKLSKYDWDAKLIPDFTVIKDGTDYGGWVYDSTGLSSDSIVYSVGLGEDTSWDEGIIKRFGLNVWGFDPTPKSIQYVTNNPRLAIPNFCFTSEAIGTEKRRMHFTKPKNPHFVSMRQGIHSDAGEVIEVQVNKLENWLNHFQHVHIDILKLDIEGTEYDVLEDWIHREYFPFNQLLVEFHHQFLKDNKRHQRVLQGLLLNGFEIINNKNNVEMSFKRSSRQNKQNVYDTDRSRRHLLSMAHKIYHKHGFVNIQLLNSGYIKLTKSWICNVQEFDGLLHQTLFVATDMSSFNKLRGFCGKLNVVQFLYSTPTDMAYGQYEYYDYMLFRTDIIIFLLKNNITVWLTESDARWQRDPRNKIVNIDADYVTMSDDPSAGKKIQGGFQFLRPTPPVLSVWTKMQNILKQKLQTAYAGSDIGHTGNEQLILNNLITNEPSLKMYWLDSNLFVPGKFYNNRGVQDRAIVILNNYIIGNKAKEDRAKRWGHWYLNENGECKTKNYTLQCPDQNSHKSMNNKHAIVNLHPKLPAVDMTKFINPFSGGGMSKKEIAFLAHKYTTSTGGGIFEWGMGSSTLLSVFLQVRRLVAVDSDSKWVESLKANAKHQPGYDFIFVDIGPVREYGNPVDPSSKSKWPKYSKSVDQYNTSFDIYLVDGRFRVACACRAFLHGHINSEIIVHDFSRQQYHVLFEISTLSSHVNNNIVSLKRKPEITDVTILQMWEKYKYTKD